MKFKDMNLHKHTHQHVLTTCALALCWLIACHAMAQSSPLKRPLQFIGAENVTFLDHDATNWQLLPFYADSALKPVPLSAHRKMFKAALKKWEEQRKADTINIIGGLDDENLAFQGLESAKITSEAARLLALTGHAHYADIMERALYNALPAAIVAGEPRLDRVTAAQAMLSSAGMVYATTGKNLYVNFYVNCFAHIATNEFDIALDQITGMPFSPTIKLRFGKIIKPAREFTLRLRIPEWSKEAFPIYVNGHDTPYEIDGGYALISRDWSEGDEVYANLPIAMHFETESPHSSYGILRAGPIVYALPQAAQGLSFKSLKPAEPDEISQHPLYDVTFFSPQGDTTFTARPYFEAPLHQRTVRLGRNSEYTQ